MFWLIFFRFANFALIIMEMLSLVKNRLRFGNICLLHAAAKF